MGFKVKNMTAQKYEEIPKLVLLVELPECIQVLDREQRLKCI